MDVKYFDIHINDNKEKRIIYVNRENTTLTLNEHGLVVTRNNEVTINIPRYLLKGKSITID